MDYHSVLFFYPSAFFLAVTPAASVVLGILLALLLLISFLMAGSEIAYFSLQHKDINLLKTRTQPSYKRVVTLLEQPKKLQAILLTTRLFSLVAIILIADILLTNWLSLTNLQGWLSTIIKLVSIIILIALFTEMLPRVWATHHKVWFASTASLMIEIFRSIFFNPARKLLGWSDSIEKNMQPANQSSQDHSNIDLAIDSLPETEATKAEKTILKGLRKFGDIEVRQIMRPRMDVSGLEFSLTFPEVLASVSNLHYSRLPVYKNNLDEPAGLLNTKDLIPYLDENADFNWHKILREPMYVHEQKLIEDLMQDFLTRHIHFAIVVDEFGGTSGIVTLEDIMEEIIGDIKDEFDDEESVNKKLDDYNYIFEGKMMIGDACVAMGIPVDTFDTMRGENDSLGGLVLELAGEFPAENTNFEAGAFTVTPLSILKNRIERVKIFIKQPNAT